MVTSKTFERLSNMSGEIASIAGTSEEVVRKVLEVAKTDVISRRRQPAVPPPEGGISIRAASRKYKIGNTTIVHWVKEGFIPVILETKNEKFIDESVTADLINKFKTTDCKGRKTIRKVLSETKR